MSTSIVIANAVAKPVFDTFLKPVFDKVVSSLKDEVKYEYHQFFNAYQKYLENQYSYYCQFTSIVFKNERKPLKDYYVPLTLVKEEFSNQDKEETLMDCYPTQMINDCQKLLIVDTAGMGKSTLSKFLFISCIEQQAGIPIFVELNKLSNDKLILDFILEQLADISGDTERNLTIRLLQEGNFIFFFDGYDEIAEADRAKVTSALQDFIKKAPNNIYFLTSREEQNLIAFADFRRFTIKPLLREEAFSLLRKYADAQLADALINKLGLPEYESVSEFLTNPLLTSLLYKSFEYKAIIPLKRHIFYRQVFEALYENHDLTKAGNNFPRKKRCNLGIDELERVLRYLGFLSYKTGEVRYDKDKLISLVENALKYAELQAINPSDIIYDLTHGVPLMISEGNYIRWTHRSLQEYFTALCICKNNNGKQKEMLLKYYQAPDFGKYINMITLCIDIEPCYFRQSILKDILEKLLNEFNNCYENMLESISKELILERKRFVVNKKIFIMNGRKAEGDFEEFADKFLNGINIKFDYRIDSLSLHENDTILSSSFFYFPLNIIAILKQYSIVFEFIVYRTGRRKGFSFPLPDELTEINDDTSSIFNQAEYFGEVNKFLLSQVELKFDEIAAQKLLNEINAEIKNQEEFLDLL